MKVLVVAEISGRFVGGQRRHMELHVQGLERIGHHGSVAFLEDMPSSLPSAVSSRLAGCRSLGSLLERCRRERIDVVNVHTVCAPAWIQARRLGLLDAKVVVMSYSADENLIALREPRDVVRWARTALPPRATFKHADGVWCVNQQDVEFYVGVYGVDRGRVIRLPHAVADGFYADVPAPSRDPHKVLFVGTWLHRKGKDVLSKALESVVARFPSVSIVLAGTQVGEHTVRSALSAEVNAHTQVLDAADDPMLAELYRSSALLLVPSRREGLPISMLEAMACGCPPLAAANSGMLDVIQPDKNGWLEVSFDPSVWAARIVELLSDPARVSAASRGARAGSREFEVSSVATRVSAWYASLLGKS
jgi:glycosyltransferase involved in cell wall biosynthesis